MKPERLDGNTNLKVDEALVKEGRSEAQGVDKMRIEAATGIVRGQVEVRVSLRLHTRIMRTT